MGRPKIDKTPSTPTIFIPAATAFLINAPTQPPFLIPEADATKERGPRWARRDKNPDAAPDPLTPETPKRLFNLESA